MPSLSKVRQTPLQYVDGKEVKKYGSNERITYGYADGYAGLR